MNAISVGIDVSKGKSMVAAMRPFGEVVVKPREFTHDGIGLEHLTDLLISLDPQCDNLRVVLEATGLTR